MRYLGYMIHILYSACQGESEDAVIKNEFKSNKELIEISTQRLKVIKDKVLNKRIEETKAQTAFEEMKREMLKMIIFMSETIGKGDVPLDTMSLEETLDLLRKYSISLQKLVQNAKTIDEKCKNDLKTIFNRLQLLENLQSTDPEKRQYASSNLKLLENRAQFKKIDQIFETINKISEEIGQSGKDFLVLKNERDILKQDCQTALEYLIQLTPLPENRNMDLAEKMETLFKHLPHPSQLFSAIKVDDINEMFQCLNNKFNITISNPRDYLPIIVQKMKLYVDTKEGMSPLFKKTDAFFTDVSVDKQNSLDIVIKAGELRKEFDLVDCENFDIDIYHLLSKYVSLIESFSKHFVLLCEKK